MGVYTPNTSTLLYGGPGVGKTALAVSSFWDWKNKKQIANGKLITFGNEDNPALEIPEHFRETDKGTSLRLTSSLLDSDDFVSQFEILTRKFIYDAERGEPLDVLVVDGLTEFDLMYEETYAGGDRDNYAKWNGLLSQMFSMMMRLSTKVLKCHIIMTARVTEKKKPTQLANSLKTVGGDPGYVDYDYYPSLRGSFRLHLPHYFGLVLFLETLTQIGEEGPLPVHVVNMFKEGDYYVKNHWEHVWLEAKYPAKVSNAMWPTLWSRITGNPVNTQINLKDE